MLLLTSISAKLQHCITSEPKGILLLNLLQGTDVEAKNLGNLVVTFSWPLIPKKGKYTQRRRNCPLENSAVNE
jgi:hypothetical protein